MKSRILSIFAAAGITALSTAALAGGHAQLGVKGSDQDVSGGTVMASEVVAGANGWLVVHRVKENGKPGPVVAHAPLAKGKNTNVNAILTGEVKTGAKLMLMLHGEGGGNKTGIFEYTLGAKEDGPVKVDGKLVMAIVTAQ